MDGLTFVQFQPTFTIAELHHARILVLGLALPDHGRSASGLDLTDRSEERDDHQQRQRNPPPTERRHRNQRQRESEDDEGASRSQQRHQQQSAEEHAGEASDRRYCVEPTGDVASLIGSLNAEPDRVRSCGAEHHHWEGDQHHHGNKRTDERAGLYLIECLDGDAEERPGDERDERQQRGGDHHEARQTGNRWVSLGEPAAVPVTDAERDQNGRDRVSPNDR